MASTKSEPEMLIATLTALRASFFRAERAYPASSETVKSSSPAIA